MSEAYVNLPATLIRGLSGELLRLYCLIRLHDWCKEGEERNGCTLSLKRLSTLFGKQVRQTQRDLALLKEHRVIRVETQRFQTHRIFCTPEQFEAGLCKKEQRATLAQEVPPETGTENTARMSETTHVKNDIRSNLTHVENDMVSEMTYVKNDHTSKTAHVQNDTLNKDRVNNNKHQGKDPPKPPLSEMSPPPGSSSPRFDFKATSEGYALYPALRKLKEAAGDTLVLGELIPSSSAPDGFTGVLRIDLEEQFRYKITTYATALKFNQADLEARLDRMGRYLASRKSRHLRSGQISLRTLCIPRQSMFEELMDEAWGPWDQAAPPQARASPTAFPKMLCSEEANALTRWIDEAAFTVHEEENAHEKRIPLVADW